MNIRALACRAACAAVLSVFVAGAAPAADSAAWRKAGVVTQDTRTMVEVNGVAVPRWMFDNALRDKIAQAEASGRTVDAALRGKLGQEVLDNLIQMELLAAEARRRGVEANRAAGELRVRIVAAQSGSEEKFNARIAQAGMTREQYVAIWQQQVSVNRLVEEVIRPGIEISENDLRFRYLRDREQLVVPPRLRLAELFIPMPRDADDAALRSATEALARERDALSGDPNRFMALASERAKELKQCFPGVQARDMGWVLLDRIPGNVPEAVRKGGAGAIGQPVASPRGVHLHKVLDAEDRRHATFEEVRDEMENQVRDERTPDAIAALTRQLRENATVRVLMDPQ